MSDHNLKPTMGLDRRNTRRYHGLVSLSLVALLGVWWHTTHENPRITIPSPVMPTPNAFDFYVKAGNAVVGERQLWEAFDTRPATRYSLIQEKAVILQNANVFVALHRGFAYRYQNPPIRSMWEETPYYSKFRSAAQLLGLQGQVRSEEGDWSGATESYLDAVRLGEDIPRGSPLIGTQVGHNCRSYGIRPMWGVVDHLNAAQSRATIARLASIMDRHVPLTASIQEEKWLGQAELMQLFDSTSKPGVAKGDSESHLAEATVANAIFLFASKKRIMRDYTTYMDQNSQQARRPYSLHLQPPREPTDAINRFILPLFMHARLQDTNSQTQDGLLLITLALHAFRLENGRYPGSLAELAPAYLKKLPSDLFAAQGTFKYRPGSDAHDLHPYVLYSVGPDGKDDGGTPIYDAKMQVGAHPEARYRVVTDSVGDIVAGKNR